MLEKNRSVMLSFGQASEQKCLEKWRLDLSCFD